MDKKVRFTLFLVIALLLAGYMTSRSPATPASAASWTIVCTGVTVSERNLWFDTAGPGTNNEGGFFYFLNDSTTTEYCYAQALISPTVSTSTYSKLKVRAAVNDGARFTVEVYEANPYDGICNEPISPSISWSDTEDTSNFLTKEVILPTAKKICKIRIWLDDYPNSIASGRTNALIDDIRIWNGSTIGWRETFTAAP